MCFQHWQKSHRHVNGDIGLIEELDDVLSTIIPAHDDAMIFEGLDEGNGGCRGRGKLLAIWGEFVAALLVNGLPQFACVVQESRQVGSCWSEGKSRSNRLSGLAALLSGLAATGATALVGLTECHELGGESGIVLLQLLELSLEVRELCRDGLSSGVDCRSGGAYILIGHVSRC